ncbi:hypothetical protein CCAX7_20940 [Capsulimonas corticalis]|uniref:Right handed beta helix domain-containing protein n=1 Tax=Capsulimonas corticalis TaxID=2219043 RepID=A0A9N7L0T6_9BACT|nr:right-handed parallel beta-helix repeat-containing protein [Capsulimonas corticalis]BDI30043.1 hypothetical protein CCAX7_20940 [Capsulimonas corticalis]
MNSLFTNSLKTLAAGLVLAASAHSALATGLAHTYVSGTGNDSNAGDRTTPCATFQAALANTLPGGVITALDAGDYGPVNITQAVTIDGSGVQASIVISSSSGTGITVNTASSDTIILRHLSITGLPGTYTGIIAYAGNMVIDDCKISGFPTYGLKVGGVSTAVVDNTIITGNYEGIRANSTGMVSLRNVTLQGNHSALECEGGPLDISHSHITQNVTIGLYAFGSTLTASDCMISGNGTGVFADTNSVIRLIDNDILNNTIGIDTTGPGTVSTSGNNHKAGNGTPGAPTPGKAIVQQ